jgi:hypothetical protein
MVYDLLAKQRLVEMETELNKTHDPVERIYLWFAFIRHFSIETQNSFNKHYEEFTQLCEDYVVTPDPIVRKDLRKQIKTVAVELQHLNDIMTRVSGIQRKLESDLLI